MSGNADHALQGNDFWFLQKAKTKIVSRVKKNQSRQKSGTTDRTAGAQGALTELFSQDL